MGDFVQLSSGLNGTIREISVRATIIRTQDNLDILVPNADLVGSMVTNWTLNERFFRIRVPFGVAYGSDKDLVRKAVLEAADRVSVTLKLPGERFKPDVWLVGFGDSSLDFQLIVWVNPKEVKVPGSIQASYLREIESSLREYDIEIPFPQRDLHLKTVPEQNARRLKDPHS